MLLSRFTHMNTRYGIAKFLAKELLPMRLGNQLDGRCVWRARDCYSPPLIMESKHQQLFSRVQSAFDEALNSGDLLFFPSTVHQHLDSGVQVNDPITTSSWLDLLRLTRIPFSNTNSLN